MTALSDAERAVAEARGGVLEFALAPLRGDSNPPVEQYAVQLVDGLIAAVRAHDAELLRAVADRPQRLDESQAGARYRRIQYLEAADCIDRETTT